MSSFICTFVGMLGRIVGGLLLIAAGGAIIYYHNHLYKLFGDIDRAERNLGESRVVYVLFGVFVIVIGVFVLFSGGGGTNVDNLEFGG